MKSLLMRLLASIFAALFLFFPLSVQAEDIEIRFEATINWDKSSATLMDCWGYEQGVDDKITGRYSYGTDDVIDENLEDYTFHTTYFPPHPYGIRIEVADDVYESEGDHVYFKFIDYPTGEGEDYDAYVVSAMLSPSWDDCSFVEMLQVELLNSPGDAINTGSSIVGIPMEVPILEDWQHKEIIIWNSLYGRLFANITSMERVFPVDDLVEALEYLIGSDALDAEQERGLYQKVASAMAKFDRGMIPQACQQLYMFMCQLDSLLLMFNEPYDDLANRILDLADEIFVERCSEVQIKECPMGK